MCGLYWYPHILLLIYTQFDMSLVSKPKGPQLILCSVEGLFRLARRLPPHTGKSGQYMCSVPALLPCVRFGHGHNKPASTLSSGVVVMKAPNMVCDRWSKVWTDSSASSLTKSWPSTAWRHENTAVCPWKAQSTGFPHGCNRKSRLRGKRWVR